MHKAWRQSDRETEGLTAILLTRPLELFVYIEYQSHWLSYHGLNSLEIHGIMEEEKGANDSTAVQPHKITETFKVISVCLFPENVLCVQCITESTIKRIFRCRYCTRTRTTSYIYTREHACMRNCLSRNTRNINVHT